MPDSFSTTTTTGFGSRITNSIKFILVGVVLFIGSFIVLYWNEGQTDMSKMANEAVELSSETANADSSLDSKLVSMSGIANSTETINDNLFLVPDKYMAVRRNVDMYSWTEKEESSSTTNTGGSETTTTTYTYSKDWVNEPEQSSKFNKPDGHQNPVKSLNDISNQATTATIGMHKFNPKSIDLPDYTKLSLSNQNVLLTSDAVLANDNYIFMSKGLSSTINNPEIGDLRISFDVLKPGFDATIFGSLDGDQVKLYADKDGNKLFRLFNGNRNQAISELSSEHKTITWIFRAVGFLMMWIGLTSLFAPLSVLLDILPILGSISRLLVGLITFIVAVVLSIVTIFVSMIVHNIIALIVAIAICLGVIIAVIMMIKNKKKSQTVSKINSPIITSSNPISANNTNTILDNNQTPDSLK